MSKNHLEFCVVLGRNKEFSSKSEKWFGFYFCGQTKNLEKCFQKKYLDLRLIFQMVEHHLMQADTLDPYHTPLLIIGDTKDTGINKGCFWQVRSIEQPDKLIGFIPLLHRTDVYHTYEKRPLISFEVQINYSYFHTLG